MTYRELYEKAERKLEKGEITSGEFDEMTKPLDEEIRPQDKWEYLKEHIIELRDANGYATQYGTCQFILNLMGVIEKEGEANEN